jgi:hypothetical protein
MRGFGRRFGPLSHWLERFAVLIPRQWAHLPLPRLGMRAWWSHRARQTLDELLWAERDGRSKEDGLYRVC